ncbi:UDP-N-acetylmuramate--L-alanine ligase [Patescibacteria group bacterium]
MSKVHFIGIKGVGMSALAIIAKQRGWQVTGSDRSDKYITDKTLQQAGIRVADFDVANIKADLDLVVIGGAWPQDHPEYLAAEKQKIKIKTYSEFLGELMSTKLGVAISGSHGKTTTTAIIARILKEARRDPSYLIGTGTVDGLDGNAHAGKGKVFVVEADEYRAAAWRPISKFLDLDYQIAVLTGIEFDHPDFFKDITDIEHAFKKYIEKLPEDKGILIAAGDDLRVKKLLEDLPHGIRVETYGDSTDNDWNYELIKQTKTGSQFTINHKGKNIGTFKLWLPGEYNIANALAAIAVARNLKVGWPIIKKVLKSFQGAQRRFDVSKSGRRIFIDDYAHHPTAIKAFLKAVKVRYPKYKIWAVFQPHTASRTNSLLGEFAEAFNDADKVLIADIFASARGDKTDIGSKDLAEAIAEHHPDVMYSGSLIDTKKFLKKDLPDKVVLATIGAGDVYEILEELK